MQAVLILAHTDMQHVINLSKKLVPYFNVYIHIDKKTQISSEEKQQLNSLPINYYSIYDVKWGSYSIVLATIFLMRQALKNQENEYFHLISGQDWPLVPCQQILKKFENNNTIYMDYWRAVDKEKSGEQLIWWVKYYFNYDQINRRTLFGKVYHRVLLAIQRLVDIDKLKKYSINKNNIYSGQEWIDIPRKPLLYALDRYTNNESLQKVFKTSFCSDEMWIQTILCNSPYRSDIDKNIHRYIKWSKQHDSYPAILDERNYKEIINSDCIWGRKFASDFSNELIAELSKKD